MAKKEKKSKLQKIAHLQLVTTTLGKIHGISTLRCSLRVFLTVNKLITEKMQNIFI